MKYLAYLCGGFSLKEGRGKAAASLPSIWKEQRHDKTEIHDYEQYYLPDFVRFCLDPDAGEDVSMQRFRMDCDTDTAIPEQNSGCGHAIPFHIRHVDFYLFPFRMAMFSICIETESGDANDFTALASSLRRLGSLGSPWLEEFRRAALDPLADAWRILSPFTPDENGNGFDFSRLVEDGNKFSVFQIVLQDSGEGGESDSPSDGLLFSLGTVAPIGAKAASSLYAPSDEYFHKIMSENVLAVYSGWKCLALSDTLTILACGAPEWLVTNWTVDYFGMIYIWQLYRRNYLFRLTRRFRFERQNSTALEQESVDFERNCSFHKISYNFLPEEFCSIVERGLKSDRDKDELYHMIAQENSKSEKLADNRMNRLLFFMTCLTMASTIYDACCLLQILLPYGTSPTVEIVGFRLVSSIMFTLLMIALLIYRQRSKRL